MDKHFSTNRATYKVPRELVAQQQTFQKRDATKWYNISMKERKNKRKIMLGRQHYDEPWCKELISSSIEKRGDRIMQFANPSTSIFQNYGA
jgi:hypothetical protein